MQLARQTVVPCSADGYNVSASVVDRFGVLLAMVLGGVPLKIGNETLVPLVPLAWPVRLAAIWTKPALIRPSPR